MATPLSDWKKVKTPNLRSNTYHLVKKIVKIGPVDPDIGFQRIIKKQGN